MYSAMRFCDWVRRSYWRRSSSITSSEPPARRRGARPARSARFALIDKPVGLPFRPHRNVRQDLVAELDQHVLDFLSGLGERPHDGLLHADRLERLQALDDLLGGSDDRHGVKDTARHQPTQLGHHLGRPLVRGLVQELAEFGRDVARELVDHLGHALAAGPESMAHAALDILRDLLVLAIEDRHIDPGAELDILPGALGAVEAFLNLALGVFDAGRSREAADQHAVGDLAAERQDERAAARDVDLRHRLRLEVELAGLELDDLAVEGDALALPQRAHQADALADSFDRFWIADRRQRLEMASRPHG